MREMACLNGWLELVPSPAFNAPSDAGHPTQAGERGIALIGLHGDMVAQSKKSEGMEAA